MTEAQAFKKLCKYGERYQISMQLWGKGRYAIFIEKNGADLWNYGGYPTALEVMMEALKYLDRINKVTKKYKLITSKGTRK